MIVICNSLPYHVAPFIGLFDRKAISWEHLLPKNGINQSGTVIKFALADPLFSRVFMYYVNNFIVRYFYQFNIYLQIK